MKINFLSNDFENYLLKKLNVSELTEEILKEVKEISINAIGNNGIKNSYDFRDFEKLENLKFLILKNFEINNYQTNEMNRCNNLEGVQFSNCIIKSKSRLQGNIQIVTFDNCRKFHFKYISLLKNLKVVKFSNIRFLNLKNIEILKSLQKIYFENGIILHFKNLAYLQNLNYIRITKCRWNKLHEKYLNNNIEIEK